MKRLSIVHSSLVVFACSTSPQAPASPEAANAPLAIAVDAKQPGKTNQVWSQAGDAPPHVFQARRHSPHVPTTVKPVDVKRLPALRTSQCFIEQREQVASGRHKVSGTGGGVAVPKLAPAPRKPSAPATGDGYAYSMNDAAPAPPPVPQARSAAPPPPAVLAEDTKKKEIAEQGRSITEIAEPERAHAYHDYGASIYLSNDDTMSLSSAQRVIFAIDRFLPLPSEHIRPHELLNYFSFETAPIAPTNNFSVHAEIGPKPGNSGEYTLGLSVKGRGFSKAERRNTALTFVVDRSGSMSAEGRMDYLKRGLKRMTSELKPGDLVNLVLFDDRVCNPIENFVVGRDPMKMLTSTIDQLAPRGSTDVHSGLRVGYALADEAYQPTHSNRVILITDALANTGVTDPEMMAMISAHYDKRRIRLSGVGVGTEFNDGLLDRLTERGKGAYVFLGSAREVDAVFGERFVSLIETTANDVHFKLQLPPSLRMNVFYGEESSTVKADVQAVHYFAGTSQLFLSDLMSRTPALRTQDSVMLSVEYENAETGEEQSEDFVFNLSEIARDSSVIQKGRLVMSFIDGLADTVRSSPDRAEHRAGGWIDPSASEQCARGRVSLAEQARPFARDVEVARVVGLWDMYCSRYQVARAPMRRTPPQGSDVWPSAQRTP